MKLLPLLIAAMIGLGVSSAVAQTLPSPQSTPSSIPIPLSSIIPDGKPHKFAAIGKEFMLDNQPTTIIAGEMHFGRIQPDDFETRVKQAKAMGLNTISFYLFWNLCEPKEGQFDFTGMNDVHRMLKICQDNGMWAVLRPGPYCCAEVEYGGIPYWTLKYPDVKIRTNDPKYVEWSKRYIEQVYKQVADCQVTHGGPLLMVQIENEYGMISGADNSYLHSLQTVFKDAGFDIQMFTCDPFVRPENPETKLVGILRGANGMQGSGYQRTAATLGDSPVYVPETYTAWFSGWGQPIATRHAGLNEITAWTSGLLDHDASLCYYMFFGGTNYGFSNGCNEYLPVQTSYDYGAPIDEAGRTTEKFRALRTLLSARLKINPPEPPADPVVMELPPITFTDKEPLLETLPSKPTLVSEKPVSMEDLDQAYGCILYRKTFPDGIKGKLELKKAQDYAIVMVNGKTVGKSFIGYGADSNTITLNPTTGPTTLDILVYNLGRISVIVNSTVPPRARKGLTGGAFLDGTELTGWDIYSVPLDNADNFHASTAAHTGPTFYHATFNIAQPAGTFLDLRNWSFGAVWVNGHNLGRFWDRGALRSLFVPAAFLKPGTNDIAVLELLDAPKNPQISGDTKIISEPAAPFVLRLDQRNLPPQPNGVPERNPL